MGFQSNGFFESDQKELFYRWNGETLCISPWGDNSLRVRSVPSGEIPGGSDALLMEHSESCEPEIRLGEREASITNGGITAELRVTGWGIENYLQIIYRSREGRVLLSEQPFGGALMRRAREFKALAGGGYRLHMRFAPEEGEKLYGMGQYQQERMNLKGCMLELAHRNSQASVPFVLSDRGYGFLWNNAAIGTAYFGANTTEWTAECTHLLDYWITAGDTPAQIERAYAAATGRTPMMPEYGLGFWQCKLRYWNAEQVLAVAREYKKRGIPLDVLVIDYYHWPRCGDWRFDPEYFPHPERMIRELRDMGIHVMVSVWPQVDWRSENYEEMRQQGLLVKSHSGVDVQMIFHGNNVFMDATNPRTRRYVWEKCRKNYAELGVSAFWLDEAEPEFSYTDFENYQYYAGPALEKANLYPREYARGFYEGQREAGTEEPVSLIRCAWAGSQRYGALVWSGDIMSSYEDFRKQICAGIHMGLAGIPWWTTDIGGFHGGNIGDEKFRELLARWFAFGAFCPVMRIHGCRAPFEEIVSQSGEVREHTGAENEIWSYGPGMEAVFVKFIGIRELLRDYTRQLMRWAHETGDPVMRAVFYEFPEDKRAWELTDEYMYGPDILVAPVCHAGAVSRGVYLPAGARWVHAGSGESFEGGQTVTASAALDTLPVYLREGRQSYLIGKV
ncbi:glycoside hydrolase family 31 protein [Lachnoclostridium sp. Marseille-P6806]|uniref:glycoside hydrolase family 31 protein n=1 Tax=Lachnoclostridium sp. Marseille-P6806 TaxID=2364793 RepID=UPI0010303F81|nr:TIM-barrel domain-containing protein [Lachnoclostridium sp. Marseille-P6806]